MKLSRCYLASLHLCGLASIFGCGSGASDASSGAGGVAGSTTTSSSMSGASTIPEGGAVASAGTATGGALTDAGSGATSGGGGAAAGSASIGGAVSATGKALVFVGGFGADPVHMYDLDRATGVLQERLPAIDAGPEPSCLAVDASRTHLYVCNEDDGPQGGVTSFTMRADGSLEKQSHQLGSDLGITSVILTPNGKFISGAGYNGGSVSIFPVSADGSLAAESSNVDFGADAETHCSAYDPTGKYLFVTTKGLDAVQQLKLDESGKLSVNTPASVATDPGAGPRHIAVHPNGKLAFVVTEAGSTVIPYQLSATGQLTPGSAVSSVPADYQGQNSGAHVELSPSGSFLYVSNRGHDSVGIFKVDQQSGALTLVEHVPTKGASPHDFDIDAAGQTLITANRKGSSLSVFRIEADGTLTMLGDPVPTRTDPTAVLIVDLK
jgi:6-phosphogluconolactonase